MKKPNNITSVWDNGGETFDRYTIIIDEPYTAADDTYHSLALSNDPDNVTGFSQWTAAVPGPHLGKEISWTKLPMHIREHIIYRLNEP